MYLFALYSFIKVVFLMIGLSNFRNNGLCLILYVFYLLLFVGIGLYGLFVLNGASLVYSCISLTFAILTHIIFSSGSKLIDYWFYPFVMTLSYFTLAIVSLLVWLSLSGIFSVLLGVILVSYVIYFVYFLLFVLL